MLYPTIGLFFLSAILFSLKRPCSLMRACYISFLSITLQYGPPGPPGPAYQPIHGPHFHCSLFLSIIVRSSLGHALDTYVLVYAFRLLISYFSYIDIATVKSPQPQLETYKYSMYVARNAKQELGLAVVIQAPSTLL